VAWFVFAGGRRAALVPGIPLIVGRDVGCDLVVDGPRISRKHIELRADGDGWTMADLSSNGSYGTLGRVTSLAGNDQLLLALGAPTGPVVLVSQDPLANVEEIIADFAIHDDSRTLPGGSTGNLTLLQGVTRLGRAADNDVVLTGALASAHHAHLVASVDGSLEVVDLASARGTYVNGARVQRAPLSPGDRVAMGGSAFVVTPEGTLAPIVEASGVSLEARGVTVQIGQARLLDDVSFTVPARSVLAVVGPSGSGKSTLLGALTGFSPASAGQVLVGGRDLYREYDELRFQVGLVPQADLVPAQLRVREALEYAARLRFPRDTPKGERSARVAQVMDDLALTPRAGLRIDRLSGGQRKRVSVALEMLTRPALLFLDEPTSGLDPGLDRQVMVLLREMADAGRTVVVVTHAVENLALADRLLILATGGHVAYFGPPLDAPAYFGVPDMPSVFLALDTAPGPEWTRRWREHLARSAASGVSIPQQSSDGVPQASGSAPGTRARVSKPSGAWGQFWTMTGRNIRVIAADRTYALLLLLLPLVLAATGFLVGSASGLGDGPAEEGFFNPEARLLLLVLVLGSVFTGGATSIQELVKDRVIYQRERAVGLSRVAYVGSKALVLGVIAAAQGFVFAVLSLIGRPGPADPLILPGHLDIAVIVAAATVTSCMLGLVFSAFLPTRDAALPALVIATMVQVVFSGAIPLRYTQLLDAVGWAMPGYWEFRAMAASTDLDTLLGPEPPQDWPHEPGAWWASAAVLAAMTFAFIFAAILATGRHDPGKRRR
jgi:ABC-type multidrug transport system ATPase subunit